MKTSILFDIKIFPNHKQGSHLSGDMKFHVFSRLFPGKSN